MAHNLFSRVGTYRDFTSCKALFLAALIAAAAMMGDVPHAEGASSQAASEPVNAPRVMPALFFGLVGCDENKTGVNL